MTSLKSLGIYTLIAVLLLLGLNFDITGYEKRVPDQEDVTGFTIHENFTIGNKFNLYYRYGEPYHVFFGKEKEFLLKDPDNIAAARVLHQSFVDHKARFENLENIYTTSVQLGYNPDSSFPLTRRYQIDYEFYRESLQFKQIFESKEFKEYFAPGNLGDTGLNDIYVNSNMPYRETIEIDNKSEMQEFMACLDRDFRAQTFEDMVSLKHAYATANINFTYQDPNSNRPNQLLHNNINYEITSNYVNTIQWLEDHGYGDHFRQDIAEIEYIELYHYVRDENTSERPVAYTVDQMPPANQLKSLRVSEPEKIQKLMDTYESQNINYQDYYYGIVVYQGDVQVQDPAYYEKYGYDPGMREKYAMGQASTATMQIYFNEGNVPDYVLEYFK